MSLLHRRFHPYFIIALLTAWSVQILAVPYFDANPASSLSPVLPQTGPIVFDGLNSKVGQEKHLVDPNRRYAWAIQPKDGEPGEAQPTLSEFVQQISYRRELAVRGVYVPDVLALPVVQQPLGINTYVSETLGTVTQFQLAAFYNVIGFLAHNYLSGNLFTKLEVGQDVYVVMGNGTVHRYQITGIYKFQKRSPSNPKSSYIDLASGKQLTMRQVFHRFYQGDHRIIFQTCLEKNGNLIWGLMFIQAEPVVAPLLALSRDYPRH